MSKLCIVGSIVLPLAWGESASGQPARPPDLSGGEGGWVHPRGTGFQPVPASPPPVRQDPGHPLTPGRGTTWRIGDLSNPNLKPWVKELMQKYTDEIDAGKIAFQPSSSSLPAGIPNMLASPAPLLILQAPKEVVMIKEGGNEIRHIYLDVPHSANPKPFVVRRIGRPLRGRHAGGRYDWPKHHTVLDIYRTPHTEKLHVVERWRTIDGGKGLGVNVTVDDSETFYQPWSTRVRDQRGKEPFIAEEICAEHAPCGAFAKPAPAA